jgi:hypothetical protein
MTWDGGALTADIVTQITCSSDTEVTNHPVEAGSEISDHVISRPQKVTFEFAQSADVRANPSLDDWAQVPLDVRDSQFKPQGLLAITMGVGAAVGAIGGALGLSKSGTQIWALVAQAEEDRVHALHETLLQVQKDRELCAFNYQGLSLSNYVITSVQYSRGRPGGIVRFTLEAQAVVTVSTGVAALPTGAAGVAAPGGVNLVHLTPKGPKSTDEVEKEVVRKSLLKSGLGALGL